MDPDSNVAQGYEKNIIARGYGKDVVQSYNKGCSMELR